MAKNKSYMPSECKEVCDCLYSISNRYSINQIFEDWIALSTISISNAFDLVHKEEREKQYFDIIKKYTKEELEKIASALTVFCNTVDKEYKKSGISDILGKIYHALELHNKNKGQFFTPFSICEFMGKITVGKNKTDFEKTIKERNYITLLEPCCRLWGDDTWICKSNGR